MTYFTKTVPVAEPCLHIPPLHDPGRPPRCALNPPQEQCGCKVGGGGVKRYLLTHTVILILLLCPHVHINRGFFLLHCDGIRCCRNDWPGLFLFCCYQPSCVVSQQSWFWTCFVSFANFTPPPLSPESPPRPAWRPPFVALWPNLRSRSLRAELRGRAQKPPCLGAGRGVIFLKILRYNVLSDCCGALGRVLPSPKMPQNAIRSYTSSHTAYNVSYHMRPPALHIMYHIIYVLPHCI